MNKKKVAFICVHNSCRSQIAEALGKHLASDVFESYSAGTETKLQINQDAVRIMKELYGIDMEAEGQYSNDAQQLTGVKYNIDNLSDVYNAIHAIQENLGVTGTTAMEASETFSGAFAMMKASAKNLLGNLSVGDGEAVARSMGELVKSASTFFFGNFIPMLQTLFSNLPEAIKTAVSTVTPKIKENVLPLISSIKETIFTGLGNIGIDTGALQTVLDQLFNVNISGDGFKGIFDSLKNGVVQAVNIVLQILPSVINYIQTLAPMVLNIINNKYVIIARVVEA